MIKESILFVASTGLLIYFLTPPDEPVKPEAVEQESQKKATPVVRTADDKWGYEDETEADDQAFAFGEPMTDLDRDENVQSRDEEDSSDRQEQSGNTRAKTPSFTSNRKPASADSPVSGAKGSIDNPIVFKTNNPSNPVDD